MVRKNDKGFSLVELLIVITIFIILVSISVFFLTNNIISSARDARRKLDVNFIRDLLSAYYIDHGFFPTEQTAGISPLSCWLTIPPVSGCAVLVDELKIYSPKIPIDPRDNSVLGHNCENSTCYTYITPDAAHSVSCICAQLENVKTIQKPPACNSSGQNYCIQITF